MKIDRIWSDKFTARRRRERIIIIIIIILITRFDCVWMQTQKSPNDPHIRIQGTNQFLTSKYSWISIFIEIGDH
jgi:hypothetical protein